MFLFRRAALALVASAVVLAAVPSVGHASPQPRVHLMPTVARSRGRAHAGAEPMKFYGGPVMTGPVNVYVVWYGDWSNRAARRSVLTDFLGHLASPYWKINQGYPASGGATVGVPSLAAQIDDAGSVGTKNLTDAQIQKVVENAITKQALPKDPNGVYMVLTSSAVTKVGFLTQYCGWHTFARIAGAVIKFAFIGDPSGPNVRGCSPQSVSPNGDVGADAMASTIYHELDEAVSDPTMRGWHTARGEENADRCAWTYGKVYKVGAAMANMKLGSHDYLIQNNWVNSSTARCDLTP
jgi:hypothetical protein